MDYSVRGTRRHLNASQATGTKLLFPEHVTQSGLCATCTQCGQCEVGLKSKTGQTLFPQPFGAGQFGAEKRAPGLEDIQIIPELYGDEIFFNTVKTETVLGGFEVSVPIAIAAMGSTKVAHTKGEALAVGAARAGIPMVIGENVIATYGKEGLKERIQPYLDNYSGKGAVIVQANKHDMAMNAFELAKEYGAHGIEVKIGQGAKQGLGGEIRFEGEEQAKKYEELGYHIEKNPDGSFQRHASPGSLSDDQLRNVLLKYSELDLPIWVKTGIGRGVIRLANTLETIKQEQGVNIACFTVDGLGGGTGMSPWLIMNETSIPSIAFLAALEKELSFDVLIAGGINNGLDAAKAMMLGASGVSMGRAFLIAAGSMKEEGVVNFVNALKTELKMVATILKQRELSGIRNKKSNLFALSKEAAEMFGIPYKPSEVL